MDAEFPTLTKLKVLLLKWCAITVNEWNACRRGMAACKKTP